MPNLWPPFLTPLHRSQKRTTKFLASNFNSSILGSLQNPNSLILFHTKARRRARSPGDRECRSQDERRRDGDGGAGVGYRRRRVQERNLPQDEDVGWPGMDDFREHGLFLMCIFIKVVECRYKNPGRLVFM